MNCTKILLLSSLSLASTMLVGCASNAKIDQLYTNIQNLDNKCAQLSDDINSMRSDVQTAKEDSVRANQRLDNMALKHKK
ncbi:LPP leucine zipper domain-containing protein [Candidatus Profftia tarda]|nr:LPP leucine zipper domain-containing protein [Candidatus Profftia tarda]